MTNTRFVSPYYIWLRGQALQDDEHSNYNALLRMLHSMPFYWILPLDEDRAIDGLNLRIDYQRSIENLDVYVDDLDDEDASVLEVLVGIARRMSYLISEDDYPGMTPSVCFWILIENLGLLKYTDDALKNDMYSLLDLNGDVIRWMQRLFDYDGTGSPFPLRQPPCDQREETITYQMNRYILENFY